MALDPIEVSFNRLEESSKAFKAAMILLQTVVIIAFFSWQQSRSGWLYKRFEITQNAVWLLACNNSSQQTNELQGKGSITATAAEDNRYLCGKYLTDVQKEQARAYLSAWNFSLTDVKTRLTDLEHIMTERASGIAVPQLGITVDVNNLGLTAGIALAILLVGISLALQRQLQSTIQLFEFARDDGDKLKMVFRLAALTQAFILPPGAKQIVSIMRLPNLLLMTPFVMQLLFAIDELQAISLQRNTALLHAGGATILLLCILGLTTRCFREAWRLESTWRSLWIELNSAT